MQSGTVTFGGTPEPGQFVSIFLARDDDPAGTPPTEIQRGMHGGDTLETIAISYAQELNHGYTGVWASVSGSVVTIYSRSMGEDGDHHTLDESTTSSTLTVSVSSTFSGGQDGRVANGSDGDSKIESRRAGLEQELLHGSRRLRDRRRDGIQHRVARRRSRRWGRAWSREDPAATRFYCRRLRTRRTFRPRVSISGSKCTWMRRRFRRMPACSPICNSAKSSGGTFRTMGSATRFRECRFTMPGRRASSWRNMDER